MIARECNGSRILRGLITKSSIKGTSHDLQLKIGITAPRFSFTINTLLAAGGYKKYAV